MASPVPFRPNRIGSAMPLIALGILAVAQLFDYVSFMVMIERHGLAAELNPIVVALANNVGLLGLTLVKAGAVLFLSFAVLLLMPRATSSRRGGPERRDRTGRGGRCLERDDHLTPGRVRRHAVLRCRPGPSR